MAILRLRANTSIAKRRLTALRRALSPAAQDTVIRKIAWVWHARMVQRTPKRWTGQVRRDWVVQTIPIRSGAHYRVGNGNKVMVYLEYGTQAHGPKRAKRLFVPLTRRAAMAGPRVVMEDLLMARASREQGQNVRARFRPGVDYVWAKWVRGIKAMRIVAQAQPLMRATLHAGMKSFIIAVINRSIS